MTEPLRIKLLRIDPECFLWMARIGKTLLDATSCVDYHACFDILDVPDGAKIHHVNYQIDMRCFVAAVEHESFDEVPIGEIPPYLDDFMTTKRINVVVDQDGTVRIPAVVEKSQEHQSWRDRPPLI